MVIVAPKPWHSWKEDQEHIQLGVIQRSSSSGRTTRLNGCTQECYGVCLEVDLYSGISRKSSTHRLHYVSSLSAETPLQLLNHSCAGLHWRARIKSSERTVVQTPRTCNGVLGTCHTAHISEDPCYSHHKKQNGFGGVFTQECVYIVKI